MRDRELVEEIWVNVAEGAEATGFHPDHVRRLARENWRLPEAERFLRIRKDSREYAIYLPDLLSYVEKGNTFSNSDSNPQLTAEIWVNTKEAAEITGYNRQYVMKLAQKVSQQPENQRQIKIRRRYGYELWLPDLVTYIETARRGRPPKGTPKE